MIGNVGVWGWLVILLIVVVLFGRGRIAGLMGEMGKGLSSFRKGIEDGKAEIEQEKAQAAKDVTPENAEK